MFVLGNLIGTLAQVVNSVLTIYFWMILIRVLLTWVSPDPYNPIVQFLSRVTDPYLSFFRRFIPTVGMIDFSPWVAIIVLRALQSFLVSTLFDLSLRMR